MAGTQTTSQPAAFLTGGGEMGALIRAHDWNSTPLGPPEAWPLPLRLAVRLILNTGHPMYIWWGPDLLCFYNDAYRQSIGPERHPGSLGQRGREVWAEIWHIIGPQIERVMSGGGATWNENQLVPITRHGRLDEVYWTYGYSPIDDEAAPNRVGGVLVVCTETTRAVLAERRSAEVQEHQRQMLRQMPGFVGVLSGPDLVYTYVNDAYLAISERTDFVGRRFRDVFADIEGQGYFEAFENAFHSGEGIVRRGMELRLHGRDEPQYVDFVLEPIRDDAGAVTGLFVGGYETTEVYRGNEALRRSEARLAFLDRLGSETAPLFDAHAVLTTTTRLLGEHLSLSVCAYADMDQDQDGFTIRGDWAAPGCRSIVGHYSLADFGKLAVTNLSAGRPLVVNDNLHELAPEEAATFQRIGIAATICMPLVKEGRLIALMAIHDRVPRVWTDEELSLLREVTARSWAHVERVGATAELRASESRFRAAVDAVQGVLWTNNAAGEMQGEQPGWRSLTGQSIHEYQGYGWSAAVHPDDAQPTVVAWNAAVADKRTFNFEHRVRRHDGEWRRFSVRAIPIFDAAGEIREWVGVHTDVTEQRATVAALRESEARLRELNETLERRVSDALAERKVLADIVEGTDAFVQVADRNFRWLAINKAAADEFEKLYGVRPKAGDNMLDLLANLPEHQAAVRAVWSRALAGEEFTEIAEFGDPTRGRRHYEMKYNVLHSADGEQIGAFQFVYDVTARSAEQKRLADAEAARRESDALYRAYFENTPEALFVVNVLEDGGFTVEDLNPAHQASLGLPLAKVRDRRVDEILPPETAAVAIEHYRRVIAAGEVYQYRETFELQGKATYWDTVLVPVRDADGRIVRLIGSSRDLTRQLAAEEQLRQSQKMEAMGQLTGGVAHDFNNLLTPIVGALDMLQRKGLGGGREQRLIAGAAQSADRAKTLVQRLLAFARRQPLQPVAVDVAQLVNGMADLVASTTGPQIKVAVDVGRDLPPANADPNQLEMALLNLAVNARDAMPEGGTLRISVEAETVGRQHRSGLKPGRYLHLSVADTGVGMEEATLARAVEPFFSTKGVGKGTGLGLSMVHGLASQLGGAITIRSTPKMGTNVELWLPEGDRTEVAAGGAIVGPASGAGQGTVLLVDDEDLVRLSTADMLIELGYKVVEAGSSEEALRILNRGLNPDIVVTDHLMPGMSGTELAGLLRVERPSIRVLIVSGYAEVDGIAPGLPRLTKPFRSVDLASSLTGLSAPPLYVLEAPAETPE